ncbi:STAS domain-containing protein [Amycolatopsis carbonis]|uniref:STAS domain-containing protein n=1 Tax=Amycolatopsis carbonis TaxID=715471 RepID=UPI00334223D4
MVSVARRRVAAHSIFAVSTARRPSPPRWPSPWHAATAATTAAVVPPTHLARAQPGSDRLKCAGHSILNVTVVQRRKTLIDVVDGDVDQHTAPTMSEALETALARRPRRLVVDLSEVRFLNSTGLEVLLRAGKQLRAPTCAWSPRAARPGARCKSPSWPNSRSSMLHGPPPSPPQHETTATRPAVCPARRLDAGPAMRYRRRTVGALGMVSSTGVRGGARAQFRRPCVGEPDQRAWHDRSRAAGRAGRRDDPRGDREGRGGPRGRRRVRRDLPG